MLFLCVRCQPTLSAVGNTIFLRDSGNQRCELLAVIVRRDHLIPIAFHPLHLLYLVADRHMHCGIMSLMRSPQALWHYISLGIYNPSL